MEQFEIVYSDTCAKRPGLHDGVVAFEGHNGSLHAQRCQSDRVAHADGR